MILTLQDLKKQVETLEARTKELEDAHNRMVGKLEEVVDIANRNFKAVSETLQRRDGRNGT